MFGVDKLLQDPNKLMLQDGVYANQSIKAVWDAIKDISHSVSFNFYLSNATLLLFEELGGNCMAFSLFLMSTSDSASENLTMFNINNMMKRIINYPVKNDENVQAMYRRLKTQTVHKQSKQESQPTSSESESNTDASTNIDRDKLFERVTNLNASLTALLESKLQVQESLETCQQEKWELEKALVEAQIQMADAKEESDANALEMTNKILSLEKELLDLENKCNGLMKDNSELKTKYEDAKKEHSKILEEVKSLRTNFESLGTDHSRSVKHNEELNLEIFNLLNAKV